MWKKIRSKFKSYHFSIQMRLILVFIFTSVIAFGVNVYINFNTNQILSIIDNVYIDNSNLNDLSNSLMGMHTNIQDYLNTKSSVSLENYYINEQLHRKYLNALNDKVMDRKDLLMEKNIKHMSEEYFERAKQTIQGKRARNIPAYKSLYEGLTRLYHYINTYIYSLNNEQFKTNSINFKRLMSYLEYLSNINSVIYVAVALCNIYLIIIMTKSITNPLKKLARFANEVAAGNFEIEFDVRNTNDEVGVVAKAFRKMIISIREYIEKLKESMEFQSRAKEKELLMMNHFKDAQLKYLQAQINPHFLFNSLNAGAQLAMLENAEKTFTFIEAMADFFRYNLKRIEKDTTLVEEIEIAENYLYIMNVRFSGEIRFTKIISCELEGIRVPGMILQPIIENAVNYGVRDLEREGVITLEINRTINGICIEIKDNGKGMTKDTLNRILMGGIEKESSQNSNGVGLSNVINRLKLYYNSNNVINIVSGRDNQGTKVSIYIPIDKVGGENSV